MKNDGFTLKKRLKSFRYAFHGVYLLIRFEHNAWIHTAATLCTLAAGIIVGLSVTEWMFIAAAIGMVLAAEAVNSSIEALSDLVSPGYNEAIKRTKDLAAGAVLIVSVAAAIIGLLIFLPKLSAL